MTLTLKPKRDSILLQFSIRSFLRFGKVTNGRDMRESQLLYSNSVSSNSCLCCVGNSRFLRFLICRAFRDAGRRPPGKDMADEQSLNVKCWRQVGSMLVMASIMDSTIGLPSTSIDSNKRGNTCNDTLLLLHISNLLRVGALGREETRSSQFVIVSVSRAGR